MVISPLCSFASIHPSIHRSSISLPLPLPLPLLVHVCLHYSTLLGTPPFWFCSTIVLLSIRTHSPSFARSSSDRETLLPRHRLPCLVGLQCNTDKQQAASPPLLPTTSSTFLSILRLGLSDCTIGSDFNAAKLLSDFLPFCLCPPASACKQLNHNSSTRASATTDLPGASATASPFSKFFRPSRLRVLTGLQFFLLPPNHSANNPIIVHQQLWTPYPKLLDRRVAENNRKRHKKFSSSLDALFDCTTEGLPVPPLLRSIHYCSSIHTLTLRQSLNIRTYSTIMSIKAGGLAQMTYQSPFNNVIGVSGPGFASRGKGSHIKRLSVAPPPKISTIDETQQVNASSTPRTSRGHLLAGLRTAPKSATTPYATDRFGLEGSQHADAPREDRVPQTATGAFFPSHSQNTSVNSGRQMYSLPEHVLAPPTIEIDGEGGEQMDQRLYDELVATNAYLAQQQRALQQQLLSITAAAQQFGGLNLSSGMAMRGPPFQSPISPSTNYYAQQYQQSLQPVIQAVPNSPGVFAVYNPITGQSNFVVDNFAQQQEVAASGSYQGPSHSPPHHGPAPNFQQPFSPTSEATLSPTMARSRSPPKSSPSPPQGVEPLPPPSANAFRRGHKKGSSSAASIKTSAESAKLGTPRSAGYPLTPLTGTFGPGQGRAGEHPIRQPRGPPLLQELQEKPTSNHEGSKNFATRQRRRAVHDLVRAGRERRNETRQTGSGSGTPGSEGEFTFSASASDNDDVLASNESLSSKPSIGSLRAAANGAIGSERKEKSRERSSLDSTGTCSAQSLSSDEGVVVGGRMVEVEPARRKTPMLVLSSAEKRKSTVI